MGYVLWNTKQRNDFVCYLVGDGPDKAKVEMLAQKLGINDSFVRFTGILEGEALVEAYNQSLFTVLYSNYENMPVVIPESFACGKPVISTDVGGIPEFVNHTNGVLIAPKDEDGLTSTLDDMLDHSMDFDSNAIREFAYKQFSKEAVKKQLMQLYSAAINVDGIVC